MIQLFRLIKWGKKMEKISKGLYDVSKLILLISVGIITVVIVTQVITRTVFGFSIVWSEELARYLLVWSCFIGASMAYKDHELVGLDFIGEKLSPKLSIIFQILGYGLTLFLFIYLIYYGFTLSFSPSIARQTSNTLPISMTYVYISIPVSFSIMTIHLIAEVVNRITNKEKLNEEGS